MLLKASELRIGAPMGFHWVWTQAAQDTADYLGLARRVSGAPAFYQSWLCDTYVPAAYLEYGYVELAPLLLDAPADILVYIALMAGKLYEAGRITPLDNRHMVHCILDLAHEYKMTHGMEENYLERLQGWAERCLVDYYGCPDEGEEE